MKWHDPCHSAMDQKVKVEAATRDGDTAAAWRIHGDPKSLSVQKTVKCWHLRSTHFQRAAIPRKNVELQGAQEARHGFCNVGMAKFSKLFGINSMNYKFRGQHPHIGGSAFRVSAPWRWHYGFCSIMFFRTICADKFQNQS